MGSIRPNLFSPATADNREQRKKMSSAPHLLQTISPIAPPKPRGKVRPSLPAHNSTADVHRRMLSITCGTKRSPDDYHATLRALNSRGRRPRKSFGQVFYSTYEFLILSLYPHFLGSAFRFALHRLRKVGKWVIARMTVYFRKMKTTCETVHRHL